ncbi:MAG TPA: polysaccharide pyruvyl transferase family protein, partial [Chthoniobacterales bacterium]
MNGILISFYSRDPYYQGCAEKLREDCIRLKIDHVIEAVEFDASEPWYRKCLYKIGFIAAQSRLLQRPVLWVDVDSRLIRNPWPLFSEDMDFAGFRRDFRPLNAPLLHLPRFWHPGIVYYGCSKNAQAFLAQMESLTAAAPENVTDDYILHEAWLQGGDSLRSHVLVPSAVQMVPADEIQPDTVFLFGSSGNVRAEARNVVQHQPEIERNREQVLHLLIGSAMKRKSYKEAYHLARAEMLAPSASPQSVVKFANVLSILGRRKAARSTLEKAAFDRDAPNAEALRRLCEMALNARDVEGYAELERKGGEGAHAESQLTLRSFKLLFQLEEAANQLRIRPAERPVFYWMRSPYPGNFGDLLTPYLALKLFQVPVRWAPARDAAALGVGSIARLARKDSVVWGSGIARASDSIEPRARWCAVRGPQTAQCLSKAGGQVPAAMGDPALLLPRVRKKAASAGGIALIPHVSQISWIEENLKIASPEGAEVKLLSPLCDSLEAIDAFIDAISRADLVLSSSLHGLIVAHAYGIPAAWIQLKNGAPAVTGDGVKFADHLESVGLPPALYS